MQMPSRPEVPDDDECYDDGDPYSCIAAGAAGIKPKTPNYLVLLSQIRGIEDPRRLLALAERDPARVKAALYDMWARGRTYPSFRRESEWAARRMADLGDTSLLDYDEAVPPDPL